MTYHNLLFLIEKEIASIPVEWRALIGLTVGILGIYFVMTMDNHDVHQ